MAMSVFTTTNPVTNRVARMSSDANARRLVSQHNLSIVNVTWEDCARSKQSVWGPCISDMTLQVGDTRMPVIREPNFTDTTWDVPIDSIPVRVGNERPEGTPLTTIPLTEYLRNFSDYISKPPGGHHTKINLLVEDGSSRDRHVVMSSQACFLPVETGDQTKFNVAMYNYQSTADNPAVLTIVSTSKGTSAQIITGGDQKLLFNNNGRKADFAGQRLRDNRAERGVALDGEMSAQEKQDNVIVIIQVPLVHREPSYFSSSAYSSLPGSFDFFGGGMGGMAPPVAAAVPEFVPSGSGLQNQSLRMKKNSRPDVVSAIVRVAPRTDITCKCGSVLTKRKAWSCYEGGARVNCDDCGRAVAGDDWVYHCDKGKTGIHGNGYDLCENCASKQLEFDECNSRIIRRDVRSPIRVTLQYYKATGNGVMDANIMNEIALQLKASRNQAEAIGSLVTEVTDRTTEPVLMPQPIIGVVSGSYTHVEDLLRKANMVQYLPVFRENEITDDVLMVLEPDHVRDLFVQMGVNKIGPRAKFEAQLKKFKEQQGGSNWMSGFLG